MPGGHGWHTADEFAPTSEENEPRGQEMGVTDFKVEQYEPEGQSTNDTAPEMGQYAPNGQGRQSEVDHDPFVDAYVPVAQGVGFNVPSLGQ